MSISINALIMDETDNVVTCVSEVKRGEKAVFLKDDTPVEITAMEDIPYCHKIAVTDIKKGSSVIKYGECIGSADEDICCGCLAADHNISGIKRDYDSELASSVYVMQAVQSEAASDIDDFVFRGYRRKEGRPGIRNHVLILPTCACGSESCRIVAGQVKGAVNIIFNSGCSDVAANTEMSQKILTGFACHPNVYGVVIIGLGCETVPHMKLRDSIRALTSKPVVSFGIQDEGGTLRTIEKAVRAARDMAAEASMQPQEVFSAADLLIGIECGGSDATSGLACNPAVGEMSDILIDMGATSMISESIEWIGGEHVLAKRAADAEIHDRIIEVCRSYEDHLAAAGQDCRAGQPTPGNKAGGLSTLEEKSLGCIRKGGTRPIVEVLDQAKRPSKTGAVVMDTAGYDISSVTSMVAAGCQAVIFTTGRGTPTGNAIAPVIKVTANSNTYQKMEDNIDLDLSAVISGEKTYRQMGSALVSAVNDVCNGKLTKAEAYGFSDIAIDHICRYI